LDTAARAGLAETMITHTLIYSFPAAMGEQDREQFFDEIEALMRGDGHAIKFEHQPHLSLAADEYAPVFAATDVAEIVFADLDAVAAASALPALQEFVGRWQARFPYKLVWANYEPGW
jgi:hypothetical protein